jgi:hypothetical protein
MHAAAPMWRNGRRNGLKIRWAIKARAGSSPAIGTPKIASFLGKLVRIHDFVDCEWSRTKTRGNTVYLTSICQVFGWVSTFGPISLFQGSAQNCEHWAEMINAGGDSTMRTIAALRVRGFDWYADALDQTRNHDVWSVRKTPIPSIRKRENALLVEGARKSRCNSALRHTIHRPGHKSGKMSRNYPRTKSARSPAIFTGRHGIREPADGRTENVPGKSCATDIESVNL